MYNLKTLAHPVDYIPTLYLKKKKEELFKTMPSIQCFWSFSYFHEIKINLLIQFNIRLSSFWYWVLNSGPYEY
jgi:hypothetical protein